jgi:hypothetical protein
VSKRFRVEIISEMGYNFFDDELFFRRYAHDANALEVCIMVFFVTALLSKLTKESPASADTDRGEISEN